MLEDFILLGYCEERSCHTMYGSTNCISVSKHVDLRFTRLFLTRVRKFEQIASVKWVTPHIPS